MKALIQAEFIKLFKQSRTYFAIGAILLIETIILISAYFEGSTVIDILLDNLKQSFYFEGELLNGNLLIYLILNTLWFHIPLILMIIISGLLTSEYKDGTLQTVMLQPVKKSKFIAAKFIVSVLFTLMMVLLLAITSFGLSYSLFGRGDLVVYLEQLSFFTSDEAFYRLVGSFLVGAVSMVFFSVVSLALAILFRDSAKTWIIAAFFLIISNLLTQVDFGNEVLNSGLFFKLNDTWQYFFYFEIPGALIIQNTIILVAYTLAIAGFGIYWFNHKDIG